jgi:hypothetical protein
LNCLGSLTVGAQNKSRRIRKAAVLNSILAHCFKKFKKRRLGIIWSRMPERCLQNNCSSTASGRHLGISARAACRCLMPPLFRNFRSSSRNLRPTSAKTDAKYCHFRAIRGSMFVLVNLSSILEAPIFLCLRQGDLRFPASNKRVCLRETTLPVASAYGPHSSSRAGTRDL